MSALYISILLQMEIILQNIFFSFERKQCGFPQCGQMDPWRTEILFFFFWVKWMWTKRDDNDKFIKIWEHWSGHDVIEREHQKRKKKSCTPTKCTMHTRGVGKWQSQRQKLSLGPVRRACPASGATWNVQVVRGKMTSRCLWHACRALALGLVLMIIGAGMATIGTILISLNFNLISTKRTNLDFWFFFFPHFWLGYYAEHIAPDNDARSNSTVRVKSDSKGIHLHNLSYAGPIVMGCGGKMSTNSKQIQKYQLFLLFFFSKNANLGNCILSFPKCYPLFSSISLYALWVNISMLN